MLQMSPWNPQLAATKCHLCAGGFPCKAQIPWWFVSTLTFKNHCSREHLCLASLNNHLSYFTVLKKKSKNIKSQAHWRSWRDNLWPVAEDGNKCTASSKARAASSHPHGSPSPWLDGLVNGLGGREGRRERAQHTSQRVWSRPPQPGACHLQERIFSGWTLPLALGTSRRGWWLSFSLNKGRGYTAG